MIDCLFSLWGAIAAACYFDEILIGEVKKFKITVDEIINIVLSV